MHGATPRKDRPWTGLTADEPQPTARRQEGQDYSARRSDRVRAEPSAAQRRAQLNRLREVGRNLGGQLDDQVRKRPYAVLGAVAGVGFVAGSVLGSRLGQMLLAAGVGYLAKRVLGGELGLERLQAGLERLTGEVDAASASRAAADRSSARS